MNSPESRNFIRGTRAAASVSLACVAIVSLLLAGCASKRKSKPAPTPAPVAVKKKSGAASTVIRPAADFQWVGAGGKLASTKMFRGQPLVLLIAASPESGDFRRQVKRIGDEYLKFSAKRTVFAAAFTGKTGRVESNIPFIIAQDGTSVAASYGVKGNGLVVIVIAPDGNVDMVSSRLEGAQRIIDMINNTMSVQSAAREGLGS